MRETNSGMAMGMGMGSGLVMAVMAGVAVGAGVALLFAPCSGADARTWLAQRSRDVKDKTMNALEQGKQAIRRTANDAAQDLSRSTSPPPFRS